jgi:four helix bundle protein
MFIAYDVSVQLVSSLRELGPLVEQRDRDLADQLRRAASSVVLNLAEGQRSMKGNKQKHYALAHGSANEVKAALHVACAWGWVGEARQPLAILDRLLALLWRLTNPRQ